MTENKDSNKKSELITKLDELLESVGEKYGPFMIEELYIRMEKTISEFNQELDSIFESSFDDTKKINRVVNEAMSNGKAPDLSGLNIGSKKDIPSFISHKKNNKITKKDLENGKEKVEKKKSFFSRKKKK